MHHYSTTPNFFRKTQLRVLFPFLKNSKLFVSKNVERFLLDATTRFIPLLFISFITLNSCSTGNKLNWVKVSYPREYSSNFFGAMQVGPKTDKNNEPWVVYSANLSNYTVASPTKLERRENIFLLEPFYVIGQRGNYLKLITHDSEVLKRIKPDRTETKYMGWIHQSNMLLSSSSYTNPQSGFKNKFITAITDTFSLANASILLKNDSVLLFANQNLKEPIGKIGFHEVVYVMKKSIDNKKVFITNKPEISADDVDGVIAGWTSISLIQNIGERLFFDSSHSESTSGSSHNHTKSLKYNPVFNLSSQKDSVIIKTGDFRPVIDRSDNFIFNGNGKPIDYAKSLEFENNLRHINVIFVFEAAQNTLNQFPSLVNTIQNYQIYFANDTSGFKYRFGAVMSMAKQKVLKVDGIGLVDNYSEMFNFVSERLLRLKDYSPITSSDAWSGLNKAVEIAGQDPDATNIIVLIGENGQENSNSNSSLIYQMGDNNCRLFCNQVYSGHANRYNNFSLQLTQFIEGYATIVSNNKKELIVDASQFSSENVFTESQKNYYRLDYPRRSMTHGAIVFPEKGKLFSLEIFTNTLVSFFSEVKQDNQLLIASYQKAFRDLGNSKNKCDSVFLEKYNLSSSGMFKMGLTDNFKSISPMWLASKEKIVARKNLDFYLLLNQQEFNDLQVFYDELTRFEVIDESQQTPKSDMFFNQQSNSPGNPQQGYLPTGAVRTHLRNLIISRLERGKIKEALPSNIQETSIGYALGRITSMPVQLEYLYQVKIGDLMDKNILSDKNLDEMVKYFEKQKQKFEKTKFESFISLKQNYYWVTEGSLL